MQEQTLIVMRDKYEAAAMLLLEAAEEMMAAAAHADAGAANDASAGGRISISMAERAIHMAGIGTELYELDA